MRRLIVSFTVATALIGAAVIHGQPQAVRKYFAARTAVGANAPPFSGAVLTDNTLYIAGQTGTGPNEPQPPTAEAEAKILLDRFDDTLKAAGMTMDDLVYVTVYCPDVKTYYGPFNNVYRTYFKKEFPARAFIGSGTLLFDSKFEMQGIAVKRASAR